MSLPLPPELAALLLKVMAEAEQQLNQELMAGWWAARSDPNAFRARRQGIEEFRLRVQALLTRRP